MFKRSPKFLRFFGLPCLVSMALLISLSVTATGVGATNFAFFNYVAGIFAMDSDRSVSMESLNATPQTLPFSQNWNDIGMITANDDWSGVPGIEGYFIRNDAVSTSAVDPQTLLGSTFAGAGAPELDVVANQVATTITSGSVAEFHTTSQPGAPGADPVVGFQGSGTADAPFLLIHLNTTGQSNVNVTYNLRDIDCTADNAVQPVALHYRVGNSGDYTNLPTGFVADATTGPSECNLVTAIDVDLPAAANNQPLVQLRIMTTNAPSNDEFVGVDDIVIATAGPTQTCQTQTTLTGSQEVPSNASAGTGVGTTSLSADETTLFVDLNFTGLSSNTVAAHIHGPAAAGTNAGVIFGLTGVPAATSGAIPTQSFTLTPTQLDQFKQGLFYFNIHTDNFQNGEIRGQIIPTCGPTKVQFGSASFTGTESNSAVVTVTRTGDTSGSSTVTFSTVAGGTATAGTCGTADYNSVSQTVTFAATETSKTVNVPICTDALAESTETVNLALTDPSGGTSLGSQSTAVLSITDTASQYRNSAPISVTSGSAGSPYPSTIDVTGAPTSIFRVRVTLYDFLPTPGDHVDVLLVGPNGAKYILMSHVGSSTGLTSPVTLTFFDAAPDVLPDSAPLTSGTFRPTSCDTGSDFPAPAPVGPYILPGCDAARSVAETLFGAFSGSNANGAWSLYVRENETVSTTVVGTFLGGWGIEFVSSTAADAVVSGRVMTADGNGLRGARVVMVDSRGIARTVTTSSLGYYQFDEVETGETYVIGVASRRYRFASKPVTVSDSLTEVDFVGIE